MCEPVVPIRWGMVINWTGLPPSEEVAVVVGGKIRTRAPPAEVVGNSVSSGLDSEANRW